MPGIARSGRILLVMSRLADTASVRTPETTGRAVRVLVLTAPIGEGHVAAARTLSEDILRHDGADVIVCDALAALPRPLRWLMSDAYRWQLTAAPWLFGLLFGALRRSRVLRWLVRTGLSLAGSRRAVAGLSAATRRM